MKLSELVGRLFRTNRNIQMVELQNGSKDFGCAFSVDNFTKVVIPSDVEYNPQLHDMIIKLLDCMSVCENTFVEATSRLVEQIIGKLVEQRFAAMNAFHNPNESARNQFVSMATLNDSYQFVREQLAYCMKTKETYSVYSCKWIEPEWLSEMYEEDKLLNHTNVITVTSDRVASNMTLICQGKAGLVNADMQTVVACEDGKVVVRRGVNSIAILECPVEDEDLCPKDKIILEV